ncbi:extracellular catalytic domain type 1 short-chain-length polyhydroxyalkanoate depolymerase [Sulfitobacter guttiformis]|uniref:Poly(Hydroxyalkanoate) depolymerase family esterase n=1 Tax=Sulfitobacter guttiformis TaxID=74349 RepID=A0A420DPP1_9RHOB|nr:PHB depolymerase family esterase [Sulfitobacter guttiformis]KIN73471.1 Poly(3-hydroxyalkanoate) depolymerase C [Sulfitobacter guttiformis KCTC 32187]RKE96133.1 poly(hydroxyalkanoate) depolymerase family esterase [Sulfitobacter guttiformis]
MKFFDVGALRPATDGARLSAAHDLVQRTLAQHGLAPRSGQPEAPQMHSMPSLDSMIEKLRGLSDLAGASTSQAVSGSDFNRSTFSCAAGSRSYLTYVPASASEGITGLIMMLHGCTQTPEGFAEGTGMNILAEKHRFVVVYPAQSRGDNAQSCWNWFSRGDQRRGRGEPAILAGIAAKVCKEHNVHRDRTFVAGLSAGAAMAVILGETYSDIFAGVGAHSGLPAGAAKDVASAFSAMAGNALDTPVSPRGDNAVPTIVFHGTADATVHPSNGAAIAMRAVNNAGPQSIETTVSGEASGRTFTCTTSSDLQGRTIVEHWTVDGQGHAWSGGNSNASYTDAQGPDASAEMIRFFYNTADKEI